MNPYVLFARQDAMKAHHRQVDKNGEPYVKHLQAVAGMVKSREEKKVAWLHDMGEDHPDQWRIVSQARWLSVCMPQIVRAVNILTRQKGEKYSEYIARIRASQNALAITVKIADLKHNLRPGCPCPARYKKAIALLEA